MESHTSWSMSLGRWGGVHVRLHALFLLFAAFTLYLSGWLMQQDPAGADLVLLSVGSLALLFLSVVAHECGHWIAAVRLGHHLDEILIGPFFGAVRRMSTAEPAAELQIHLSGPLVNLAICLVLAPILIVAGGASFLALLNPLAPEGIATGPVWLVMGRLTFWINWIVLLINLIPVFPFDGGQALRAGILWMRPDESHRRAVQYVALLAKMVAVVMLIAAFLLRNKLPNPVIPVWFPLTLLAILLYFSAKQEEQRAAEAESADDLFGYDFSQGYTSLEKSVAQREETPGPVARWLARRRAARLRRQRQIEAEEERRVDEILKRLHEHGVGSLSSDDQALLRRVSARYRQRQGGNT